MLGLQTDFRPPRDYSDAVGVFTEAKLDKEKKKKIKERKERKKISAKEQVESRRKESEEKYIERDGTGAGGCDC